jgi:hypothetical protein
VKIIEATADMEALDEAHSPTTEQPGPGGDGEASGTRFVTASFDRVQQAPTV